MTDDTQTNESAALGDVVKTGAELLKSTEQFGHLSLRFNPIIGEWFAMIEQPLESEDSIARFRRVIAFSKPDDPEACVRECLSKAAASEWTVAGGIAASGLKEEGSEDG